MPWNKTDRSFKTLINKRVTDSDAKFYFNEKGDFTINTHQLELWVDAIPSTAPGSTTDVVEYHNTLTLVEDTSVPSKQAWFATSNSSTTPAQTDETSRLKNWISDKYGSTYEVVLYDTSDVQIPPSDGCGWFFDYQTGILTFTSTTTTTGGGGSLSSRAPFKIKGYRYIGRTGLDGNIIKNEVRVATTPSTSFSGWSYSSELIDTGVTSATLSIDGISLSSTEGLTGDRILVKDWSTFANNGIYYVERAGDGASDTWRFRRAPDFNDTQDIFPGTMVFVRSGTVNARTVWSMSNASFSTLDAGGATGNITFAQFITATTRWSALTAPDSNLSLAMSTYTTTFNWPTGTSSNNLLSLTTDASANGTGVLLNIATGASSTVIPLRVRRGTTDYLTVNSSGGVLVGNLTSSRVVFAGTNGLLQDSSNLTFDGNQIALSTTGSTGGLLIGGDTNLYRSAANVLATDDHFSLETSNSEIRLKTTAYSGGILINTFRITAHVNTGIRFIAPDYTLTFGGVSSAYVPSTLAPSLASSATLYGAHIPTSYTDINTTGNFTGEIISGYFISTSNTLQIGSHSVNRIIGTKSIASIYDDNGGSGAITSNAYSGWFEVSDNSSLARVTNAYGLYTLVDSQYSDNSQTRYGLYIDSMPDPGVYTGTTTAAIFIAGTGASRDGILFTSDTNLYRSASNTLKTDDSFIVGTNLSILNAGTFSLFESGSVNFSSFAAGSQSADIRYTLPTSHPSTNQVLTATAVSGSGPYDVTLAWSTSSGALAIGGAITSGTAGSVLFVGGSNDLQQDNSNFFWDDTNNTLGVGTTRTGAISGTNPSVRFKGTGSTSGTSTFEIQDSGSSTIFFARNDGKIGIGTNSPSFDLSFGGEASRTLSVNRRGTGAGNNLTIQSGGAQSGATNSSAGNLILSSGTATGSGTGYVDIYGVNDVFTFGATTDNPSSFHARFGSGRVGIGTSTLTYDMNLASMISELPYTYVIGMPDSTVTSGHSLQIQAGHAITTTDLNGGTLILTSGNSTGSGSSNIEFQTATAGSSGGTTRSSSTKMTLTGAGQLRISTTGSAAGILLGGDANLYRSSADVLKTDDSFVVAVNLTVNSLTTTRVPFASTSGLLIDSSSFTYTTGTGQLALSTTGSGAGILLGGDAQLYRSATDTLRTPDSLIVDANLTVSGTTSIGSVGGTTGTINLIGSTSGTVSILVQASAGTYNFNLPTTAGSSGYVLTSGGGSGAPMTWTDPAALAVQWNSIANPNGNQSLTMSTRTTTWNWATGTSTNNLFNLTTDASSNGTGALLRVATGASSTVVPLLVIAAGTTALTVDTSGQVLVNSLTSGRVTFAGTSGLLTDSSSFTYTTGTGQLALSTTGSGGGILLGGDAQLYRSAADVLRTPDSLTVDANLTVGTLTSTRVIFAGTSGLLTDSSSFTYTTGTGQLALSTTGSGGGILLGGDAQLYRSSADTLRTPDSLIVDANLTVSGTASVGAVGGTTGTINLIGSTSGTVSILTQAAAGTYNFNLPTTAGSSGHVLTSGGGSASAMTWTDPASLAVRWNSIVNPNGNESLTMGVNTTTFNWATGTSTNNLFSLTTDSSANGTGALLRVATGASATVIPLLVSAGATTALTVNASAQVLIGTLSSGRVVYSGTSGLLQDSANLTFDGNKLSLATTGSSGGIVIGGDATMYRSAANRLLLSETELYSTRAYGARGAGVISHWSPSISVSGDGFGTPDLRALLFSITLSGTNNVLGTAVSGDVFISGSSGTSNLAGVMSANIRVNSAMSVSEATGYRIIPILSSTGNISTYRGIELRTPSRSSSGTITTSFGLDIQDQGVGGGTNAYGIYIRDQVSSTNNYAIYLVGTSGLPRQGIWWNGDTNLYRSAADTLKTDDSFIVSTNLTVNSLTSTRVVFASTSGLLVDSSNFTYVTGTGQLSLAVTGSGAGILIGGDTQIYRSSANVLRTPDSLTVDQDLTVSGAATVAKAINSGVVTLTDGATPALDASLGNTFLLTATGDRTIAVPTNPTSGQKITIVHKASGGSRTLALNTGAGGFRFGTDITALTATTSGSTDYIGAIYNSADSKWDVVSYIKGFA